MRAVQLAFSLIAMLACQAQENVRDTGPTTLVIAYGCNPAQRVQLRQYMLQNGLRRLQQFKESSVLASYQVLFSRYVDTDSWDMLALLSFAQYADVEKWKRVERNAPAGLSLDALALTTAINTYPVDLVRQNASDAAPEQPVFLVIPYTYSVSTANYLKYVDDYLKPQFDGGLTAGILARYGLYLQRYGAARAWDGLVVLEYVSDDGFGRARLKSDQSEPSIALEKQAVIADELIAGH